MSGVRDDQSFDGVDSGPLDHAEVRRLLAESSGDGIICLSNVLIEGMEFGSRDLIRPLERVDFTGSRLVRCAFTNVFLRDVRFQKARLEECDLRYAEFERTSFKRAILTGCDLYRARLGNGTVFEGARIIDSSLNLVSFDGVSIPRDAISGGLLQEHEWAFAEFHRRLSAQHPGENDEEWMPVHIARRYQEASDIFRTLSAHWSSVGRTRDSGWAYFEARRLEVEGLRPDRMKTQRESERRLDPDQITELRRRQPTLRWVRGMISGAVAGFGERPMRVLVSTLLVMCAFAVLFGLSGVSSNGEAGWSTRAMDAMLFSAQSMTASLEISAAPTWAQWAAEIETALGITLLGLLGFCLGNRLRSA